MEILKRLSLAGLTALWMFHSAFVAGEAQESQAPQPAPETQTQEQPETAQELFPPDQIEQLVAPIALYPDALLAQILMAATYPLDVVQAARWIGDHSDLEGEALEQAADKEPWDPSVKSLVFFPSVLEFMNDNLDWTQDLGDAVLAQQDDLTAAVQALRKQAQDAGHLQTTEQQRVETQDDTIIVQPADPEIVYVPTYNPSTVYAQTAPPATTYYPSTYVQPESSTSDSWVTFGAGALVGGLLTAAILWNRNDDRIYYGGRGRYGGSGYWNKPNYWRGGRNRGDVNISRTVNRGDVNVNRGIVGNDFNKWEHNPERRGGVRYRSTEVNKRYGENRSTKRIDRDAARGRDRLAQGDGKGLKDRDIKPPQRRPEQRPDKRPAQRPDRKPEQRPAKRPDKKPEQRPAKRPDKKPADRPKTQHAKRPEKREAKRSGSRSGNRSSAFKMDRGGGMDRAASRRGSRSRDGGGRAHGGGRGARGGGGGRGGHRGR